MQRASPLVPTAHTSYDAATHIAALTGCRRHSLAASHHCDYSYRDACNHVKPRCLLLLLSHCLCYELLCLEVNPPLFPADSPRATAIMQQQQRHSLNAEYVSTFKDLLSGTAGGMCGIFVGQPLDRVKVIMQTRHTSPALSQLPTPSTSTLSTIVTLTRREGVVALWKGVGSPLAGAAPLNALTFAGNGKSLRYIDHWLSTRQDVSGGVVHRPYWAYYVSGCVGGLTQTVVAVPTELVKCRLQVQYALRSNPSAIASFVAPASSLPTAAVSTSQPTTAMSMFRHIYQQEGVRGLFRGFSATALRDTPSYGVYFLAYEYTKDRLLAASNHHSPLLPMLAAGGIAGCLSWLSCYPVDVVKSVIQTESAVAGVAGVSGASSNAGCNEAAVRGGWSGSILPRCESVSAACCTGQRCDVCGV